MADNNDDARLQQSLDAVDKPEPKVPAPKLTPVKKSTKLTPPPKVGIANIAKNASPASHKPASVKAVEIADTFTYDTAMHMAFIGVGQGGGKIAQSFWEIGYRRVGAFNTTDSDFEGLDPQIPKLSLNIGGAAKNMQLARNAVRESGEDIYDLITRAWGSKFDCAIICVGLGGGTGGGSALPFVELARKYMTEKGLTTRVGAIVSLPSVDEGQQVCRNAITAFNELHSAGVSPLIIIDNDKIADLYNPPMSQLLPKSNELISQLFHLFNQLANTKSSHITFDRAEFAQLMDNGIVVMGSADIDVNNIKGPADISTEIREQLAANVLADIDLRTGSIAACVFVAGQDVLDAYSKDYFAAGYTTLNRLVGSALPEDTPKVVHRGLYVGEDGLQCYTMVSQLEPPMNKLQALARQAGTTQPPITATVAKHLRVD